jgi:hypothetical protein
MRDGIALMGDEFLPCSHLCVNGFNQSPVIVHPTANNDNASQSQNFNLEHYTFVIMP